MSKQEALRKCLRDNDYKPAVSDPDGEEMWEDPAGHVMIFEDACKLAFETCRCCGEYVVYLVSSSCSARHEAKDCLCYKQSSEAVCDNTVDPVHGP